jgi:hypothetical protein
MKPNDLLKIWPNKAAIAKAFGVKKPSVYDWFYDGAIPEPRQYQAQVLSRGKLKVKPQKVVA